MRTNLSKKVLGLTLGAALAGAVVVGVSAQTGQQTTPNEQNKQENQMCPMMKDAKTGSMDMSKMKNMKMSEMKGGKMQNMDMSTMKENCEKMMGATKGGRPAATEEKKSEHQPDHKM
mgnify:CR=1 FL=1